MSMHCFQVGLESGDFDKCMGCGEIFSTPEKVKSGDFSDII